MLITDKERATLNAATNWVDLFARLVHMTRMMRSWHTQAACAGHHHLVFPNTEDETAATDWETLHETHVKEMCAECPVAAECLAVALTGYDSHGHSPCELQGVWGGTNRWERRWLAANPETAVELRRRLDREHVNPAELRAWGEHHPPPGWEPSTGRRVSVMWGYPSRVVSRWRKSRDRANCLPPSSEHTRTPWGRYMHDLLNSEPGVWFNRTDLIHAAKHLIPEDRLRVKQSNIRSRRGHCTTHGASDSLLDGAMRNSVRSGLWERRVHACTGRVQYRVPPLAA